MNNEQEIPMSKQTSLTKVIEALKANEVAFEATPVKIKVSLGSRKPYGNHFIPAAAQAALDDPARRVQTTYSNFSGTTYWEVVDGLGLVLSPYCTINFTTEGAFHSAVGTGSSDKRSVRDLLAWIKEQSPESRRKVMMNRLLNDLNFAQQNYEREAATLDEWVAVREARFQQAEQSVMATASILNRAQAEAVVAQLDREGLLGVTPLAMMGQQIERRDAAANRVADIEAKLAELGFTS